MTGTRMPGRLAVATAGAVLLAGCTSPAAEPTAGSATSFPAHVHGVGIDPADGTVLLATHEGLIEVGEDARAVRVGPVIDLMGFVVAGPDRFLASGHPGLHVDLPQPVGLIESRDGGRTWQPASRQGISDFHALTVSAQGVLGYDGTLLRSTDGEQWEQLAIPAEPHTLAASPDGGQVLATTAQGVLRSTDGGSSWSRAVGAPVLQVVDWADDGTTAVGVDPSGVVWISADGAVTWQAGPDVGAAPHAVVATSSDDGALRIAAVTTDALVESRDGGRSFEVVLEY